MGKEEAKDFREFLKGKGVDLSPEFKPRKRGSLRDSVRRLKEMNLGLAVLAAALLAAGAAFWKIERPGRPARKKEPVVELVLDCSPVPAPEPRTRAAAAPQPPRAAPFAAASRTAARAVYHVVRPGDTLIGIASKHYGQGWRWTEIARANPQAAADSWKLKVGAKLLIPHKEDYNAKGQPEHSRDRKKQEHDCQE